MHGSIKAALNWLGFSGRARVVHRGGVAMSRGGAWLG